METFDLLEKYLKQNTSRDGVRLTDYWLNGSTVKLKYNYQFTYSSGETDTMYDGEMEVEVLDYITWVYNLCKS